MQRAVNALIIIAFLAAGVFPLGVAAAGFHPEGLLAYALAGVAGAGWTLACALFLARRDLRIGVRRLAAQFGIETRFKSFESVVHGLLAEMERRSHAMVPHLIEKRITSKEELSRTLERIVAKAYRLLSAESAELALFDKESGLYHSSFVLGKPFRSSAQAMLAGAIDDPKFEEELSPDVLVQPVAFGGAVLGSLRVALARGSVPSLGDREIMHLLAMQGGLAIVNAQYHEELMRMKRAGDESVKAKTGFLANLSHELRGPLGLMINAVELVVDGLCGPVNEDQLETLRMVRSNGEHLLELVNDVLDYAKVESGKIVAERADIVVNELLKDITGVVRGQAEAKRHSVRYRPSEDVLTVSCDRRHLRQILINMLTNAIKYTPDEGTIELWAERAPGGKVKILVSDTGVGIEEADRYKVFSPFERIEHAYSINQVGTGLGMPLTKRLAEVNGGSLDFSSTPGKGSLFWVILPGAEYSPQAKAVPEQKPAPVQGKGERILLLERNGEERAVVQRYLSHLGFRVTATSTKLEALHVLRHEPIELVIVDNSALDSAAELVPKEMRENARSSRLPILLLSSRAFVFDIEKYLKAGVDRCLSKPVGLESLGIICRRLLDGGGSTDEGTSNREAGPGKTSPTSLARGGVLH